MSVKRTVYCSDDQATGAHAFFDVREHPARILHVESLSEEVEVSMPWADAVAMAKAILSEDEHAAL